jgi:hypothetical protein
MPLDPSIISSYNPGAGIDVNALMQQRMQGMENINALERQRKADDIAMQDRAAAQQKEQEAATLKALLPAYTYGIQTGDIEGALNLAPPDMRDGLMPYAEALRGKSPEQVRAALYGSLAGSPEGQEALAAIQRAETAGIQREQNVLTREDINFRRQKAAAEAARGPGADYTFIPTDRGILLLNKKTGETRFATASEAAAVAGETGVPGPRAEPVPAPTSTAPISAQPPQQQDNVLRPAPKEGAEKTKDLREQEAKSLDLAAQMTQANKITDELDAKGVKTSDALVSFTESLFAALPDAAGKNLAEQMRAVAENLLPSLSADEQRLARAQIQFVDAVLRSRSGAEIKTSEFPSMYRVFFPTEADENNPEIVADKKIARRLAVDTMRAKSGTLGAETLDRILRENGVLPPATGAPVAPGASFEGFEVLGVEPEQ